MTDMVTFAGNDYLGLATHPAVVQALQQAAARYGISGTGSRWSVGWTDSHEQLERDLTRFCHTEDACIFGAAYLGGAIYFGRMAAAGYKVVFCDETVHSNLYLGMRAAGLEIRPFRHLDAGDLRQKASGYSGGPAIVATDGVYGISGEVAPLAEMAEVAERMGAAFFVDDAHGFGAFGATGRGTIEFCGIDPRRVTLLGSMSKAMGVNGGFLAGSKDLVQTFRRSPEASGSSVPPPAIAAAAVTALEMIRTQPGLLTTAHANAATMRHLLAKAGIGVVCDKHPIVAMLLADEHEAAALSQHFLSCRIRIPYFKYASEPRHNMLRAVARGIYTERHLERFAEALRMRPAAAGKVI